MTNLPTLAESDIQQWVGPQSYARGRTYYRQGAISHPRRQGMTLKARCQGSRDEPYSVEVTLDERGIGAGQCSCPVGYGGRCKHAAALLLTWLAEPDAFVEVEDVGAALERLDKPQLIALVQRMARRSSDLGAWLETELTSRSQAASPAGARPVDAEGIRLALTRAFDRRSRWGDAGQIGLEVQRFLEVAEAHAGRAAWADAATAYQAILRSILERRNELAVQDVEEEDWYDRREWDSEEDEYEDGALGELDEAIDRCLYGLEGCLKSEDTPAPTRRSILETLFDVYRTGIGSEESDVAGQARALIVEQATREERELVAGLVRENLANDRRDAGPYGRHHFGEFLLELEADRLDDETYLRICRESGMLTQLVTRLLDLGRAQEAAEAVRHAEDMWVVSLADLFASRGQGQAVEPVVRERVANNPWPNTIAWLKSHYRTTGDLEAALSLTETHFWRYPNLNEYREVKELAQALGRWEAQRDAIRKRLLKDKQLALLTQVHLEEGEVDRALETLEKLERPQAQAWGGYGGYGYAYAGDGLKIQVARAAEDSRPDDAIRLYLEQVHGLIRAQGRENYAAAAGYLARVRDLHRRRGQGDVWRRLIADLRERERRLRALQDELNKAGLFEPEPDPDPAPRDPAPGGEERPARPVVRLLRSPDAPQLP
jgi:uncharacterized Zn finger protein